MLVTALTLLALAVASVSLTTGAVPLAPAAAAAALVGAGDPVAVMIVQEVRLPRTLLALLIGAGLGVSGAAMQAYLRNPLAAPDLTGASNAAALGAVAAILSGAVSTLSAALPVAALLGALGAVLLLRAVVGADPRPGLTILGGIAIASVAAAATTMLLALSSNPFAILEATFWLIGSLADRSSVHLALAAPPILAGIALLATQRRALTALSLGPDVAASLGVSTARTAAAVLAGTAAAVAGGVAVAGVIGFVGLVVPHLVRPLVGHDPGRTLLPAGLAGAVLTLSADVAVRLLPTNGELGAGVVTALVGLPFFLVLLARLRRSAEIEGGR